jgi:cyanophycinase
VVWVSLFHEVMMRLLHVLFAIGLVSQSTVAQSPLPPIAELPGPLVIVGGGGMPDAARKEFIKLAGGSKAKIVVVPTASADAADETKAESFLAAWKKHDPESVTLLHAKTKEQSNDPAFLKPLSDATAVWFSGGDQSRIAERYLGTKFETELMALHRRGSVIGGTSAGAAIQSREMITGGKETATLGKGFDLLPGFILDQHFLKRERKGRLIDALAKRPGYIGLGIDEATAVVVTGRTIKVLGSSTATVILSPGANRPRLETALKSGQVADLFQLRKAAANRALDVPFPPKQVPEPVVPNGSLVIVGGGGLPKEITDRFFELAGGKDALIVVVPTAQEDPQVKQHPEEQLFKRLGATNVKTLHTRDRNVANSREFSDVLTKAKAVWFGGGRQWRFVDAYAGTLTETRFFEVLNRGGVIGGSSAGASIQSEYMPRGHPLGNAVMDAEGYERGFGFLPGTAVDQHFFARKRTADMTGLMTRYPQYLGIGIDEATALVVRGSTADVIGKSKAAFYDYSKGKPAGDVDYVEVKAGESYDLKMRAKRGD